MYFQLDFDVFLKNLQNEHSTSLFLQVPLKGWVFQKDGLGAVRSPSQVAITIPGLKAAVHILSVCLV